MSKEDKEGAGGAMKKSFGNAFGITLGCFATGIVILMILMVLEQLACFLEETHHSSPRLHSVEIVHYY